MEEPSSKPFFVIGRSFLDPVRKNKQNTLLREVLLDHLQLNLHISNINPASEPSYTAFINPKGTVDRAVIHPRELVKQSLLTSAAARKGGGTGRED